MTIKLNEPSIADLLFTLNNARVLNGKTELQSWKASKADLMLRIEQEQPAPAPVAAPAADAQVIAEVLNTTDVPVTIIPPSAPELTKPAKRNAAINKMATNSVETDTPTTVIEVNKAARSLRKEASDATKLAKLGKVTTSNDKLRKGEKLGKKPVAAQDITEHTKRTKATAKKLTGTAPVTNEFGAYLTANGIDAKIARAKLRRAGFSAPYSVTDALKAALTNDSRKKVK